MLAASGLLIGAGLVTPALETRVLIFWRDEQSILQNIELLQRDGKHAAWIILASCAVAYPAIKLAALAFFWMVPFPHRWRRRIIVLLRALGRLGMVDVLALAAIVLASATIGPIEATPRMGLYLYAAGICLLMFTGLVMDGLARHGR